MGENYRIGENLFVIPVDMENRYVEDIAREAALRIVEICEKVGQEHEERKNGNSTLERLLKKCF